MIFADKERDFGKVMKDAIHCLDIPSRRPRLDKYSQKSTF